MKFYIWSTEHNAWWKAAWAGYTSNRSEAGEYELDDAINICESNHYLENGPFEEAMVPVDSFK